MRKIYAIADVRDKNDIAWVTDPIILDNDIQASMAYANYQKELLKNGVSLERDLRLYQIGAFDNDDIENPIKATLEEIPVNLTTISEDNNE